jgi:outer membrane protein TolC
MYEERKKIAEVRLQIGADSKVEVLLSRSDLNKALSSQYQLQLLLLQAKADLNTLLSRLPSDDFKVNDTLMVNWKPELEELKKSVIAGNINLLLAQKNELICNGNNNYHDGFSFAFPFHDNSVFKMVFGTNKQNG